MAKKTFYKSLNILKTDDIVMCDHANTKAIMKSLDSSKDIFTEENACNDMKSKTNTDYSNKANGFVHVLKDCTVYPLSIKSNKSQTKQC